jgi:DeoR family transcriptional regulator, aga operon transcriptional repressor
LLIVCERVDMGKEPALSGYERQGQLERFVRMRQRVSIEQICEQFGISTATARRDLEALAKNRRIQRIHGGAIALPSAPPEPPILQRSAEQTNEKQRIARAVAALVQEGDTVFLGSGTTVLEVAHALHKRRTITVISNSLLAMNVLADVDGITLIGLGGMLRSSEMSFIGHITEQALSELRVDKVIIGIRAVDIQNGLTNDYLPETQTDRTILHIGQQVIVAADHSKCRRISTTFVAPVTSMDIFVTDEQTPPDFLAALEALNIQVITA